MGLIRSTIAAAKARAAAGWRLYRRVPWPLRWPATILIAVFLAVIVANLVFGASRQIVRQDCRPLHFPGTPKRLSHSPRLL